MKNKNIVEAIGTLGIILSLIFVGLELRQNSTVARLDAHQSFINSMTDFSTQLAYDEEMSDLYVRTFTNPESITPQENIRFTSFYRGVTYLWYGLYQSVEEDVLPEQYLSLIGEGGLFAHPLFPDIWKVLKTSFSEEFVTFFEALPWNSE